MKFFLLIPLSVLLLRILRGVRANRNIERPATLSSTRIRPIERRDVAPMILATVIVSGSQNEALNSGFRQLAGYIFGGNISNQSISMTAPVAATATNTSIAMTAPVATTKQGDTYKISFMMPSKYTLGTVPKPLNSNIFFEEVPATSYYIRSFSGRAAERRAEKKRRLFESALQEYGLISTGSFTLNQYNDPRTPPRMRTNERRVKTQ